MNIISITRPWGSFTQYTLNEPTTVKIIHVTKGEALSLQYHNHRSEFWKVLEGNPRLTIGDTVHDTHPDGEFLVPEKTNHRIEAPNDEVKILEIAFGTFDEDDIIRVEDKYGRA